MDEKKQRIPLWVYPKTLERIEEWQEKDNCKSKSEFIEKAVLFYCGYLSAGESGYFLPLTLESTLSALLEGSENRMARLLFKITVEMSMLMNLYAADCDVDETTLQRLRGKCVKDIKQTNGKISLDDIIKYQNGID